jgi:multiple sugar transport system substrate-binding protein
MTMRSPLGSTIRTFLALLVLASVTITLAGPAQAQAPVKIRFLQMEYDNGVGPQMKELAAQFMKENPDIQVEIMTLSWSVGHDTIQTWIKGKTVPDAGNIAARWLGEWYDSLEPWETHLPAGWMGETFPASFLKTGMFQGKAYGLPYFMDDRVMYYRPDVFEAKGVKVPTNWDELKTAARALNDPDKNFAAFLVCADNGADFFSHQFENFLYANGGDFWDANGKVIVNQPEGVATMDLLCGMVKDKLAQPGALSHGEYEADQAFKAGDAAMWTSGPWLFGMLDKEAPDLKYAMAPIPVGKTPGTGAMPDLVVLFKDSPNKEAAAKFTQFLYRPEIRKAWLLGRGCIPDTKATIADPEFANNPKWKIFIDQMQYAHVEPQSPQTGRLYEELTKAGQACMLGNKTAKQAVDDLAALMEKEIKAP